MITDKDMGYQHKKQVIIHKMDFNSSFFPKIV